MIFDGNISQAFGQFSPELISTLTGDEIYALIKISQLKENVALMELRTVGVFLIN